MKRVYFVEEVHPKYTGIHKRNTKVGVLMRYKQGLIELQTRLD